jgi:hypothetical protein
MLVDDVGQMIYLNPSHGLLAIGYATRDRPQHAMANRSMTV